MTLKLKKLYLDKKVKHFMNCPLRIWTHKTFIMNIRTLFDNEHRKILITTKQIQEKLKTHQHKIKILTKRCTNNLTKEALIDENTKIKNRYTRIHEKMKEEFYKNQETGYHRLEAEIRSGNYGVCRIRMVRGKRLACNIKTEKFVVFLKQ